MPQLGESVVEGTVVRWIAKAGQRVERDEPLLEVSTDKANTEVPSPSAGVVVELLAKEGAVVPVGGPLLRLDDAAPAEAPANAKADGPQAAAQQPANAAQAGAGSAAEAAGQTANGAGLRASPVVRNVAQEHGLDLEKVPGTGAFGRITKADVMSYLEKSEPRPAQAVPQPVPQSENQPPLQTFPGTRSQPPPAQSQAQSQAPAPSLPPLPAPSQGPGPVMLTLRAYKAPRYTPKDGDQVIPFDQRRRLIAEHMIYSKATSPHVPCTAEVDMTALARLRTQWKSAKETQGRAPSFLVGVCKAAIQALGEMPRMNAVVQDESLILRRDINLGVAVETEKGLLVPVIRKASEKSVLGLSRALEDLAARARTSKVTADELSGGSFTVSNPGLKGNLFGAAIINQPQVGILRMGEIVKRAVVREIDGEDAIVIRQMMYLTLSYDHRVIDGVTGNTFLHRVRELLEAAKFPL